MKKQVPWNRNDKLAAASLAVGMLAIFVGLLFPEVRRKLGLEKPAPPSSAASAPKMLVPTTSAPTAEAPPKVRAVPRPKPQTSISQSNSGGTNVQQATTGDNSPIIDSPVTINPGPPPPTITICISEPRVVDAASGEVERILTLTTSAEVAGPTYGLEFSGPILKSSFANSPDMAMNVRQGVTTPNAFAFQVFQTWFPGQRINVGVHSIGSVIFKSAVSKLPNATFVTTKMGCNSGL
jgi:hypothetical protein